MNLIPLEVYNQSILTQRKLRAEQKNRRNGISCPECGEELYDTIPGAIKNAGKFDVHCICGFNGERLCQIL